MPRREYYQDVGNPVQSDRLPATRPQLALPHPGLGWAAECGSVWRQFVIHQVVLIVTLLLTPSTAISHYPLLTVLLIGGALWFLWCSYRIQWDYVAIAVLAATAIITMSLVSPPIMPMLALSAAASGFLAWQFAQHWTTICTASPLERRKAEKLRRDWSLPLAILASLPLALVILGWLIGSILLPLLLLALIAIIQVFCLPWVESGDKFRVFWNAIVSWCNYNSRNVDLPGLLPSPAGTTTMRSVTASLSVILVTSTYTLYCCAGVAGAGGHSIASTLLAILAVDAALLGTALLLPIALVSPILIEANRCRRGRVTGGNWRTLVTDMQHSPDATERRSYYMGRVVKDGSPLIVPREVFQEHAHFLGDSGAGKTSLGLNPWMEQTVAFGDCSLVLIDPKAHSLESLASLTAGAESFQKRTGLLMPLKHFTNQSHLSTYAFNPVDQPYWRQFDPYIKTDFLNGAAGILYGKGYGEGWFTSANAAVTHHVLKNHPEIRSCRELAERIRATFASPKKSGLHSAFHTAGAHVQEVFDRLGAFDALNVTASSGHPKEVVQAAIDLTDVFHRPQILYFHLSSIVASGSSPEIARFVVYSLLCAASQTKHRHPVFLVIDEFQRIVAKNLEVLLQLARSLGIGVILANQSMQDLGELIPSIEANCRYRQ